MLRPFKMFCWEGEEGDFNAFGFNTFEHFNPTPGGFHWSWFDSWLDFQKSKGRKTMFSIATHLSSAPNWNGVFYDATPQWVYSTTANYVTMNERKVGRVVKYTDPAGVTRFSAIPLYSDAKWQEALKAFILAFGRRYDSDPRLDILCFAPGLDMETQPTKSPWPDGSQSYGFSKLCPLYVQWHREAFPTKPLFLACAPGQGRMDLTKLCKSLNIGVKHNGGFLPDLDSWDGYGLDKSTKQVVHYTPSNENYSGLMWGLWDHIQWALENDMPIAIEDAHGMGKEEFYNGRFGALNYFPVAVDLHSDFFNAEDFPSEWLSFIETHTATTIETAPSVWCCLRDSEYAYQQWSQKNKEGVYEPVGISGHIGNWNFGVTMDKESSAPVVKEKTSDAMGRQCRLLYDATFHIDPKFPIWPYEVSFTWLQQDKATFTVEYTDPQGLVVKKTVTSNSSGMWNASPVVIESRDFRVVSSGVAVHLIEVIQTEQGDQPEPVDFEVISTALTQAEMDLEEAEQRLVDSALQLNEANAQVVEANARLADVTSAIWEANANVDNAKTQQASAQEQIDLCQEQLAIIRAEIEKAAKG